MTGKTVPRDADPWTLTLLTTRGISAVKTYRKNDEGKIEVEGYGRAKTFTQRQIKADSKGRWLRSLRPMSESFVVLGAPENWKPGEKKRRLSQDRDGAEKTIKDVPRALMPIDIDQIDFEPWASIDDGEMFAQELLERLGLKGVACTWHLTNGHGFFGRHRARLWIELAEPATAEQMRDYAKDRWGDEKVDVDGKQKNLVDFSVYQPQQPIYTGDPILEDDIPVPVKRRVGHIAGEPLELKTQGRKAKRKEKPKQPDPYVTMFEEHGLYIKRLKPGQHCISCPWEEEHSGAEKDDDTFYFEPYYNGHDIPAYKCHHDSCAERKLEHVLEVLGEQVPPEWARAGTEGSFSKADGDGEKKPPNFVFVYRLNKFWDARDGALIEREHYDAMHAGVKGAGKPSDRFLAMQRAEKADAVEFLPGLERFQMQGRIRVLNTYVDQRIAPDAGINADPWIDHLTWLVEDEREREILMDWLAWTYQHPDKKIVWGPILFSRAFGVGKTTVFDCLAKCIGRKHVSEPTQAQLEDKFNDWAFGIRLVKIEELMSEKRYLVAEKLKPVVANPTLSIRGMYAPSFSVSNFANVCASTNHMNALPIEKGDRRWMLIQCREAERKERRPHMKAFHKWLEEKGHGGIAHWLASRNVSRFQPKGEAPVTRLRAFVAEATMTDFDRAVELCDVFDKAGIVSSDMIESLLENCNIDARKLANQFGNIAYRRGWKSPSDLVTGLPERMRVGGKRPSVWLPTGEAKAYQDLLAKTGKGRVQAYEKLLAKVTYGEASSDE